MRSTVMSILFLLLLTPSIWGATPMEKSILWYGRVDFKSYILIHKVMSKAQVLSLLGPP